VHRVSSAVVGGISEVVIFEGSQKWMHKIYALFVTGYGKITHFVMHKINKTEHFAMLP